MEGRPTCVLGGRKGFATIQLRGPAEAAGTARQVSACRAEPSIGGALLASLFVSADLVREVRRDLRGGSAASGSDPSPACASGRDARIPLRPARRSGKEPSMAMAPEREAPRAGERGSVASEPGWPSLRGKAQRVKSGALRRAAARATRHRTGPQRIAA